MEWKKCKMILIQWRHLDSKAIFGLIVQGAFDTVNPAAILDQGSELNMGKMSYDCI